MAGKRIPFKYYTVTGTIILPFYLYFLFCLTDVKLYEYRRAQSLAVLFCRSSAGIVYLFFDVVVEIRMGKQILYRQVHAVAPVMT